MKGLFSPHRDELWLPHPHPIQRPPHWGYCGCLSVENPAQLKGSHLKDWGTSVYGHACYAYCQEFLPANLYPWVHSPAFFPNLSCNAYVHSPVLAVDNTTSCVGLHNKIGHTARCYRQLMQVPVWTIRRPQNVCYFVSWLALPKCEYNFDFLRKIGVFYEIWSVLQWWHCDIFYREVVAKNKSRKTCSLMTCRLNNQEIEWRLSRLKTNFSLFASYSI